MIRRKLKRSYQGQSVADDAEIPQSSPSTSTPSPSEYPEYQYDDEQYFPLEVQLDEYDPLASTEETSDGRISVNILYGPTILEQDEGNDSDFGGIACEICGRRFPNIIGIRTHMRSHKNEVVHHLEVCQSARPAVTVTNADQKRNNLPALSQEEEEEKIGCVCSVCKRSFPNIIGLRTHQRFHKHLSNNLMISPVPKKKPKSKSPCVGTAGTGLVQNQKTYVVVLKADVDKYLVPQDSS